MNTYRYKPQIKAACVSSITPLKHGLTRIGFSDYPGTVTLGNHFIREQEVKVGGYMLHLLDNDYEYFDAEEFGVCFEADGGKCT